MRKITRLEINFDRIFGLLFMIWGAVIQHPYLFGFGMALYIAGETRIIFGEDK